jgi:hypothetical protein
MKKLEGGRGAFYNFLGGILTIDGLLILYKRLGPPLTTITRSNRRPAISKELAKFAIGFTSRCGRVGRAI